MEDTTVNSGSLQMSHHGTHGYTVDGLAALLASSYRIPCNERPDWKSLVDSHLSAYQCGLLTSIVRSDQFVHAHAVMDAGGITEIIYDIKTNSCNSSNVIHFHPSHQVARFILFSDAKHQPWLNVSEKYIWSFIRGVWDTSGQFLQENVTEPKIQLNFGPIVQWMTTFIEIPHSIHKDSSLILCGVNAIDFLGKVYEYSSQYTRNSAMYKNFVDFLNVRPDSGRLPVCRIRRTDEHAVLPSKCKQSDVGYDLTIIKEAKRWSSNRVLYDTGIQIAVENGYYAEVVPRSSLSKSGYMLANSIGIIDPSYRGNIYVALVKVDPDAPDLTLPFRCCQIIIRRQTHVDIVETDNLDDTLRSNGGFGSTG